MGEEADDARVVDVPAAMDIDVWWGVDVQAGVSKFIWCFDPPMLGGGLEGAEQAEGVKRLAEEVPLILIASLFVAIVENFFLYFIIKQNGCGGSR